MEQKSFSNIIAEYADGEPEGLVKYINSVEKIDIFQWMDIANLFTEQRIFNIPCSSVYIQGTSETIVSALQKLDAEDGSPLLSVNLGFKILSENPIEFKKFLDLYIEKISVRKDFSLMNNLLRLIPKTQKTFWESFYYNFISTLEGEQLSDVQLFNMVKNVNVILDMDTKYHRLLSRVTENSSYPTNRAMHEILHYSNNYNKSSVYKNKLSHLGRNEDNSEVVKKLVIIVQRFELEEQLNVTSPTTKEVKPKNKI